MMFLILFVLHDPDKLKDVLQSWENAGVKGITILYSTGVGSLKSEDLLREDLPLIPNIEDLLQANEVTNRTLFSVVEGEDMVDRVVKATEDVIGNLDEPNTGILTVIPVARAYGLHRKTS